LIETEPFRRLPVAVQRRLLRRGIGYVRENLRSIDFRHIEAIRVLIASREGSGRLQLPGLDIYRSFDWLRLAPPGIDTRVERDFEIPLRVPGLTKDNVRGITIDVELLEGSDVYNGGMVGLDGERCAGPLLLRNWRPGDRLQPRNHSSADKIKTLFQEWRVPLWERRRWPVIVRKDAVQGEVIVWTRQFGIDRNYAAGPASRSVLMIREITESKQKASTSIELKHARSRMAAWGHAEPGAGL
jgi:tRNA(Ile)-lysidine synthase